LNSLDERTADLPNRIKFVEDKMLKLLETEQPKVDLSAIEARLTSIEEKNKQQDEQIASIGKKITDLSVKTETQITVIATKVDGLKLPDEQKIVDSVYNKLKADLKALSDKIDKMEPPSDKAPKQRILYFTARDNVACIKTDAMAKKLKDVGYPITIITLEPTQIKTIQDVPRVFECETGEEYRSATNVVTYLSSLTF
jgi:SMC interacting uncharacterized protein involved in chromosome segregation